jgi:hypothetical protein
LVFRNSPLSTHEWVVSAAQAGICVSRQNAAAFWKFHDFLFERQNTVTKDNLDSVVREFLVGAEGISADAYLQCAASSYPKLQLERELADSRALNIHATPTFSSTARDSAVFATRMRLPRNWKVPGTETAQRKRWPSETELKVVPLRSFCRLRRPRTHRRRAGSLAVLGVFVAAHSPALDGCGAQFALVLSFNQRSYELPEFFERTPRTHG